MWWNLALGLLFTYISYLLTPTPPEPEAASLEDFDLPKAREGDEVGILYGTHWLSSPQLHWYGDLKSKAIKAGGKK